MQKQISFFFITFCLLCQIGQAQKFPMTFGLQFKPIVPIEIIGMQAITKENDGMKATLKQRLGYSLGMIVRQSFTKTFALEVGINLVQRDYEAKLLDDGIKYRTKFNMTSYEIPIQGLVYVKINNEFYINGSGGFSLNFLPSNYFTNEGLFEQATLRSNWIKSALTANFGIEYRTESAGSFYFGFSYMRPLSIIAFTKVSYKRYAPAKLYDFYYDMRGDYITLDLRYFFPVNKDK